MTSLHQAVVDGFAECRRLHDAGDVARFCGKAQALAGLLEAEAGLAADLYPEGAHVAATSIVQMWARELGVDVYVADDDWATTDGDRGTFRLADLPDLTGRHLSRGRVVPGPDPDPAAEQQSFDL